MGQYAGFLLLTHLLSILLTLKTKTKAAAANLDSLNATLFVFQKAGLKDVSGVGQNVHASFANLK
jgi:hypothetical protein